MDATDIIDKIRGHRRVRRRRKYVASRLSDYRAELVALRQAGASIRDLVVWLRYTHRCRVAVSTVWRYLKKLPEMQQR